MRVYLYTLAACAAIMPLASPVPVLERDGNFSPSCLIWGVSPNETSSSFDLIGHCTTGGDESQIRYTSLHLDLCYSIDDGQLVEANHTAPGVGGCQSCSTSFDGHLYCQGCPKNDGTLVDTSINLNIAIENSNGYLYCLGYRSDLCTLSVWGPWYDCDWWKYGYKK
ncbi:hypothetical protein F4677DRAFT_442946 [Hypoxylon crocopeplum]|nr:hypothetical protein F4677DRAFT_442946 [Hypoxylon crocopeplum]